MQGSKCDTPLFFALMSAPLSDESDGGFGVTL